jgi:hypothetical protein
VLSPDSLSAIGLQGAAALAAGYGAWLCVRLQRYGSDRRLRALALFFGLFAASVLLHAVWEWQISELLQRPFFIAVPPGGGPPRVFQPQGAENVDAWLAGHHLLMLASLGVGVFAFGRRRAPRAAGPAVAAAVGLAWFSDFVPLMLALEAALTLYLAVRALLNHLERRSPGALQVFAGFALFFLGHLLFYTSHEVGRGRQGIGDILTLVGIVILVQVLPPAPRGDDLPPAGPPTDPPAPAAGSPTAPPAEPPEAPREA